MLAGLCGLTEIEPFEYVTSDAGESKVVTFVPPEHLDKVADAMFAAGAGRIGDYEQCSYRLAGEGTFFGTETTNPKLGRRGRLEKVAETRIEVVASDKALPEVVAALRRSHPYEEPAFDIYPLTGEPATGVGRVGDLPRGMTLGKLAASLKKSTRSQVAMIVGMPATKVLRAAVCVGAAGRLPLEKRRSANCDVIVTGEIRHHDALTILRQNRTAIALGHWESERPVLRPLARRLMRDVPGPEGRRAVSCLEIGGLGGPGPFGPGGTIAFGLVFSQKSREIASPSPKEMGHPIGDTIAFGPVFSQKGILPKITPRRRCIGSGRNARRAMRK